MIKYIVGAVLALIITVGIAIAVAIPVAQRNAAEAAKAPPVKESGYLFTVAENEKSKDIILNLADGRLAKVQLVLEIDPALASKDPKNPDRKFLVLQDKLLRALRETKTTELLPENQGSFKKRIEMVATEVLGKKTVYGVYLTGVTVH